MKIFKSKISRVLTVVVMLVTSLLTLLPTTLIFADTSDVVNTGSSAHPISFSHQNKTFYANGRNWLFYSISEDIKLKTSTDGITWSAETKITDMYSGGKGYNFDIYFDGVYFSYAWSGDIQSGNSALYYRRGVPNTDGTVTWSAAEQTVSDVASKDYITPAIVVDSTGITYISATYYQAGVSSDPTVWRNDDTDGTWTTSAGFPYALTTVYGHMNSAVILSTNAVLFTYSKDGSPANLKSKYYDGDWDAGEETITTDFNSSAVYSLAISNNKPAVTYIDLSTTGYYYKEYTVGAGWSAATLLLGGYSTLDPVVGAWNDTGDVIVFAKDYPATKDMSYKVRISGVWSSWQYWFTSSYSFVQGMSIAETRRTSVLGLAYAINDGVGGHVYYNFLTNISLPTTTTVETANVTTTTATLQGTLDSLGDYTPVYVSFQYGTTTSYGTNTGEQSKTVAGGVSQAITGLTAGTTYHVRVRVRYGTANYAYGADVTFATSGLSPPTITTGAVASATTTTATLQATLDTLGDYTPEYVYFEYGLTNAYGTSTAEQTRTTTGGFNQAITGLTANTGYHYRAVVRYSGALDVHGSDAEFTTSTAGAPTVSSIAATGVTISGATIQGSLLTMGDYMTLYVSFEYGLTNAYGSTTAEETLVSTSAFNKSIIGLLSNTTYHFRARVRYATSSYVNGSDTTFITMSASGAPNSPTNFVISSYTVTTTTLTWNKDAGATNTMVRWSTTNYPSAPTEGTQLYNSTGLTTTHNGQTTGTRYYYSAWTETGGVFSDNRVTATCIPSTDILSIPDVLEIETLQIYTNYVKGSTGDQIIVFSSKILWNAGTPSTYNASDFFYVQVLDDGIVIKQDRLKMWGYTPNSLYVSSTTPLIWNKTYTFKIIGTGRFSTPPSVIYTITSANYMGEDWNKLANWSLDLAGRMQDSIYWDTLVEYSQSNSILNSLGSQIFSTAIAGLANRCPQLFYPEAIATPYVAPTSTMDYRESLLAGAEDKFGTAAWSGIQGVGTLAGTNTDVTTTVIFFGIYLLAVIWCVKQGAQASNAMIACYSIVLFGTWMGGVDMTIPIAIAIIGVIVFVLKKVIIKGG